MQNGVVQGLSSAIMTNNVREAEAFSHVLVQIAALPTSTLAPQAQKLAALRWRKRTGGGRESGSDAWKVYMRRQTNTIVMAPSFRRPGIKFDL